MKLKTDSTHKSFVPKSINSYKLKRIALKVGLFITTIGLLICMSGCNNTIYKNYYTVDNTEIIQMYEAGTLSSYEELETLNTGFNAIDEDFINNLPSSITGLTLKENPFIMDLSMLPEVCPKLEELRIEGCYSITNFEFIKGLKNLKRLTIEETIGINQELINYLDENNIEHNLTEKYVDIDKQVQEILDSIISEDMSEEEKIQKISLYVMKNIKYDKSNSKEYNSAPLEYALKGKGVCINYAALTNALCAKAGIYSVLVKNDNHGWNLVKINDKYYYVDVTNIKQIPIVSELLLKYANVGFYYKQDPYATSLSAMDDVDKLYAEAPQRILELIKEANDEKSFIEKYGSNLYVDLFALIGVLIGIGLIKHHVKEKYY